MKKKHLLLLLLLLLTASGGMAQQYRLNWQKFCIEGGNFIHKVPVSNENFMYIPDFRLGRGETKDVTIYLQNNLPIWMLQLYLQLPEGISVSSVNYSDELDYWTAEGASNPNTLTWGMVGNELRIISMNNSRQLPMTVSASGQAVLTMQVTAAATMELGEYTIATNSFKFVAATSQVGEGYIGDTRDCKVTILRPVTSIALNKSNTILYKNEQEQLQVSFTPSDATETDIEWSSSNESVATVDANGMVTAHAVGTATITATNRGTINGTPLTATCVVTVRAYVESITLNKTTTEIYVTGTEQLVATVLPADASNKAISWSSSNPLVATVSQSGLITAHSLGFAYITATTTDGTALSATCLVRVTGATSITLNKTETLIYIGYAETLYATVLPADLLKKDVVWTTCDASIATVNSDGLVTAIGRGITTITATTTDGTNLSASCLVNVLPPYAVEIDPMSHLRGTPADTVEVAIRMINKELISDLQFDITLPEGVEFAEQYGEPDIWLNDDRRARNHQLSMSLLSNGKYRVLVSSPTFRTFKDHDGPVIFMNVILPQYHDAGDYDVTFSNIKLVEADETPHTLGDYSQTIHYNYLLGDADADTEVDVADYTATALNILELPTIRFYEDAANVNDTDPVIDVYDLRGIVNIILGYRESEIRPAPTHGASESDEHNNEMALGGEFSISNSQFSMNLENGRGVAAMQMDVTLPAGVTVSDALLTGRAPKHQLSYATLANGQTRLLISACNDAVIEPGDGEVVTLTLEGMTDGTITVDNILAVEPNLTGYRMQPLHMTFSHTGVSQLPYGEGTSVRVENGSLVIDSKHAGTAQLVMLNGIVMPLQVNPGRNSYPLTSGYYILRMSNNYVKVRIP